jgi:hypothetical protein
MNAQSEQQDIWDHGPFRPGRCMWGCDSEYRDYFKGTDGWDVQAAGSFQTHHLHYRLQNKSVLGVRV